MPNLPFSAERSAHPPPRTVTAEPSTEGVVEHPVPTIGMSHT